MTDDVRGAIATALEIVCEALRSGELAPVEAVLAPDVRWDGCRSPAEVMAALHAAFAGAHGRPHLREAQLRGDHAVLHVTLAAGAHGTGARRFVLAFDDAGRICRMQGYEAQAVLEHDLALLAAGPPAHDPGRPPPALNGLVAFVHVVDMARSLTFYRLLGLTPVTTYEPGGEVVWAFLRSGPAQLMLARADAPVDHRVQAVLLYLYADDLAGLRDHLVAHGVAAGPIFDGTPGPKQEMRVEDPDGYVLMIAQVDEAAPPR